MLRTAAARARRPGYARLFHRSGKFDINTPLFYLLLFLLPAFSATLHTIVQLWKKYLHICAGYLKTAIIFVKNNLLNISLWQQ
jgi:hypothetical protein